MRYRVPVCRIGYRQMDVDIEANTPEAARARAEDTAGSLDFPPEQTSDYEAGQPVPLTRDDPEEGCLSKAGPNDSSLGEIVARMEKLARDNPEVQFAVDDLVYAHIGTSKSASNINNQGIHGQAEALSERVVLQEIIVMLQEIVQQFQNPE